MKKLLPVLVICWLVIIAAPNFISAIDLSRGIILDVPREEMEWQFGKLPVSLLTSRDSLEIGSFRFTADTFKVLAILVEWSDRPSTYPKETFDTMLFSRNSFPIGSVADYYDEVSYGKIVVTGEVIDWYNAGTYTINFDFESLLPVLDSLIDYSLFDGNNDGDVDAVCFIHSGNGMEDSHTFPDIWSYAHVYAPGGGPGPFDGVHIPRWNTSPETRPLHDPLDPPNFTGVDTLNRIRVIAHELGHCLGLKDLYDYDDRLKVKNFSRPNDVNDHPVNDWCLMGYGGYGLISIGYQPATHLCGWSKNYLGWVNPLEVVGDTHIVVYDIETNKDSSVYILPIKPEEGEYFLLEYRNPRSSAKFDKFDSDYSVFFWPLLAFGSDTLDRGLLITHAHDFLAPTSSWFNDGTPTYPHYSVKIVDAGYDPSRDTSYNPEGHVTDSAQWWYPYESQIAAPFSDDVPYQNLFSPTTYPNSDGYFGPSGIVVQVDSIVDDRLFAYVYVPIPTFSLLSPSDSAMLPFLATFQWSIPGPWEDLKYDLYVSTSPVFHPDSTAIYDSLLSTQYTDSLELGRYYWKVKAYYKSEERWSQESWTLVSALYGDVNSDKQLSISDVVYLINYLFKGGSAPAFYETGDCNCDGDIAVDDIIYLINYLFKGGPAPGC